MKRWLAVGWAVLCLVVATNTTLQMYVTFAPQAGLESDSASSELAGMERARGFWSGNVWLASSLLAISGMAVAVLAWPTCRVEKLNL